MSMGELSPVHWLIVIGVVVLVFGSRRLPDAARAVGQSLRILQAESGALRGEQTGRVPDHGTEDPDADAERLGAAAGVDRAGGGHGGVPGPGGAADHDDPGGDARR
jgi:sec-independent protein translocase protein TatA